MASRKMHDEALKRFKLSVAGNQRQRKRESSAARFAHGEQWPEEVLAQRRAQNSAVGPIGARPCLVINNLIQPLQQLENQMRSARLAPNLSPKSGKANRATADMLQALYRNIEVQSNGGQARLWAYRRALRTGRGYYRVLKTYSNDGDFDQDIVLARILNQASVYLDPFATEPDWSDGMFAFLTVDYPPDVYAKEWPKSKMAGMTNDMLTSIGDSQPDWVTTEDGQPMIRVAEYWRVEMVNKTLITTQSGWKGFEDAEDRPAKDSVMRSREVQDRIVKFAKINAEETLEESEWDGKYIPIIPVIGNEDNLDGDRIWDGIVNPAMDSCRVYNYQVSKMVEATGLAPLAPYVVAEGQIEGYEQLWAKANNVPFSTLPYKPVSLLGQQVPPPQRNFGEPPIQAIAQSIHQSKADIQASTGFTDPSLGLPQRDQSGRAILALQKQSDTGNSGYLDNLANVSMQYEAKVILDLIPHVYDTPGRVVQILGIGDEPSKVMLNAPFMPGPDGQPQPAPPSDPGAILHDLKSPAEYGVVVTIGKQYSTARQEGTATIGELMPNLPPNMVAAIAPTYIEGMDFPQAQEIADIARKTLPPELQPQPEGQGAPIPPQIQAQMAQMQQQGQQAQQQMQQMGGELQQLKSGAALEQAKLQAQMQQTQMKIASDQQIALAKIMADKEIMQMKLEAERMTSDSKHQRDMALNQQKMGISAATEMAAMQHDQELAAQDAYVQQQMSQQEALQQAAATEQPVYEAPDE